MPRQDTKWPFRWDLLLRYRFIETIALWEGRLTTRHLCDTFGIGRQQASKDINNYIREVGPGNLEYDKYLKGYKPTGEFVPRVTQGLADEYLHLMARNNELTNMFESLALGVANVEVLSVPVRDVRPEILRPIMQAARQQKRLEVDYVSINNPDREGRIIVPHTLVYTGDGGRYRVEYPDHHPYHTPPAVDQGTTGGGGSGLRYASRRAGNQYPR
jgi:predicted DNA-binding transcriptional regulator YafY